MASVTGTMEAPEAEARNVVEALIRVVRDLPAVGKGERMQGPTGGYTYRGIEAMTAAAQPLFGRHGVIACPRVLESRTEAIEKGGKPWVHREMRIEYILRGPRGQDDYVVLGPFIAEADDNSDKSANKCMTQAYKQMLLQVLMISDRKDDPDEANQGRDEHPKDTVTSPAVVGAAIASPFYSAAERAGVDRAAVDLLVKQVAGVDDVASVPRTAWNLVRDGYAQLLKDRMAAAPEQTDGDPAPEAAELGSRKRGK